MRGPTRFFRSQRSQGMVEFALIVPVLLLFFFGIVDFGRVIYYYVTLQQAANEGARVAVRAPAPPAPSFYAPRNVDVLNAVKSQAVALTLTSASCPNGPIDSNTPGDNTGWVYITQPGGGPMPAYAANAPGGQPYAAATGSCNPVCPAAMSPPAGNPCPGSSSNSPIQFTIRYNFVPITPLISQVVAGRIVILAYAIYRTEY